ncbi:MAG: hypothetical protein ACK5L3_03735 [Oscillospiraceae bacterium]
MYELKITNRQWWCYDIFGNIGWVLYGTGLFLYLAKNPAQLQNSGAITVALWGCLLGAALLLAGLAELISERVQGLSRVLPKARLYRGFGAIACGALVAAVASAVLLAFALPIKKASTASPLYSALMPGGALLCFAFVSRICKGFVKQSQ